MQAEHATKMLALQTEYRTEVDQLKSDLQSQHEAEMASLNSKHQSDLDALKAEHRTEMETFEEIHKETREELLKLMESQDSRDSTSKVCVIRYRGHVSILIVGKLIILHVQSANYVRGVGCNVLEGYHKHSCDM